MQNRQLGKAQSISAAKSGISERSGRRIEQSALIPTPKPRHWRTRIDPLQAIWESALFPLLQQEPTLSGLLVMFYSHCQLSLPVRPLHDRIHYRAW